MTPVERSEIRALAMRLDDAERERSDARDRADTLVALQAAFTAIARSQTPDEAIALLLRAAFEPLGFRRAIYFAVDRENGVRARFALDGSDAIESCDERPELRNDSALVAVLRGEGGDGMGVAGELSAPVVDVRNWYVLSALERSAGTLGVLYVDDHRRSRKPVAWEAGLVRALATIAAVSIDNAMLFARTKELATRDPLTSLLNRRAFGEAVDYELSKVRPSRSMAYVLVDVDDFKNINDTRGHAHGDTVLKLVATTLAGASRAQDLVGRFAGDEFSALLVDVDAETARSLVARISADFRAAGLRCSLGAALYPQDARDSSELFSAADRALYATKAAGKNGYSFA
jgi:diguanylate cyclase (GGDEF)-like protein